MAKLKIKYGSIEFEMEGSDSFVARRYDSFLNYLSKNNLCSEDNNVHLYLKERQSSPDSTESTRLWSEIKKARDEGQLSKLLKSGDRIPLTLTNGERIDLAVGKDKNGKIYFIFHYLMKDDHPMNKNYTNKGGWKASDMRRYVNKDVFNLLPDEVQDVIVPTKIVQILDNKRIETMDNLFCLSRTQVCGPSNASRFEPEDSQIDIFVKNENRVKTVPGNDDPREWWLRSPVYNTSYSFCGVDTDGSYNIYGAYYSAGVTAAFRIN